MIKQNSSVRVKEHISDAKNTGLMSGLLQHLKTLTTHNIVDVKILDKTYIQKNG